MRMLVPLLVFGLLVPGPAAPAFARQATPSASGFGIVADLRNDRYCEVLPTYREGATLRTEVWNTQGLNDCPAAAWRALNAETLATELGAVRVLLNGPRYWTMDRIEPLGEMTDSGKQATFDGIEMTLRATLETAIGTGRAGSKPYAPTTVLRQTRYTFDADKPVHTLTAPDGRVFVMQSYAQMVDPTLAMTDLENLDDRLTLPEGWRYRSVVLGSELILEIDGEATVVQDDLLNTYQLATVPVPGLAP